jgi:uncharacterized protein (TIGR02300 family)
VAKAELGTKRTCPVTGKKFYDLDRDPIVSPYTGQSYPRSMFEPQAKVTKPEAEEEEVDVVVPGAEFVPIEAVDAEDPAKAVPGDDIEIEDIGDDADDTFLEQEEDEDDSDVADLIDGDIEEDEES